MDGFGGRNVGRTVLRAAARATSCFAASSSPGRARGAPARSSAARSGVISSTVSPARRLAFVSPSVTYGPKRPSLSDDRLPAHRVVAELRERRRGGAAAALLRLGEQRERLVERDREQLLLGLERPRLLALLDVRPVAAVRGDDLLAVGLARACAAASAAGARPRASASPGDIDLKSDAVRGFSSPSSDLGDVRAVAARCARRSCARSPDRRRARAPAGPARAAPRRAPASARPARCRAAASARWPSRSRYGPYRPTRTTMSLPGIAIVLISRASMSPRCCSTSSFSPASPSVAEVEAPQPARCAPRRRTRSGRGRPPCAP